jgi:hypothetical protein
VRRREGNDYKTACSGLLIPPTQRSSGGKLADRTPLRHLLRVAKVCIGVTLLMAVAALAVAIGAFREAREMGL